jgi:hypothetical protein
MRNATYSFKIDLTRKERIPREKTKKFLKTLTSLPKVSSEMKLKRVKPEKVKPPSTENPTEDCDRTKHEFV